MANLAIIPFAKWLCNEAILQYLFSVNVFLNTSKNEAHRNKFIEMQMTCPILYSLAKNYKCSSKNPSFLLLLKLTIKSHTRDNQRLQKDDARRHWLSLHGVFSFDTILSQLYTAKKKTRCFWLNWQAISLISLSLASNWQQTLSVIHNNCVLNYHMVLGSDKFSSRFFSVFACFFCYKHN